MTKQVISIGLTANDGTGDSLRVGAQKINENFSELYTFLGNPTTGQLSVVSTVLAGAGITVNNPSGNVTISSRVASTTSLGSVKVDGTSILIDQSGVISAQAVNAITDSLTSGDFVFRLDSFGNLLLPAGTFGTSNIIATEDTSPVMLAFGSGEHGGPALSWIDNNNPTLSYTPEVLRNTLEINGSGLTLSLNANAEAINWTFDSEGKLKLPEGGDIVDSTGVSVLSTLIELPIATDTVLGGVIVDGTSIIVDQDGVISASGVYDQSLNIADDVSFNSISVATDISATSISVSGAITASTFTSTGSGVPTITSATNINFDAANAVVVTQSPFRLASFTTVQRDALFPMNGDMIYNTTTSTIQGYQNNTWVDLGIN